jgi:FemAB-related protein (PEP-CTERM system-associated)
LVDVRTIDPDSGRDSEAWDAFVAARAEATFFHRAGWQRVIQTATGHACPYLLAETGGEPVGVLPLTLVKSPLFGRRLVSTGFCVHGGPLAIDATARDALVGRARRIAADSGAACVEYRCALPEAPERAVRGGQHANFSKAIDADNDANLKAVPRKQRAMVRKGLNAGLTSRADRDIEICYRIYAESVRNLGTPVFPKRLFRALIAVFPEASEVTTVETPDGTALASVLSFFFRDTVLPYYGGGTSAARRWAGNDVMYWDVMRRAAERGYTRFDFGRSKVDSGAYAFKKNWGFEPVPLSYSFDLVTADAPPDLSPANPKYARATRLWQRLPRAVADRLGPWIARDLA